MPKCAWPIVTVLLAVTACEPPPLVEVGNSDPTIELLHPGPTTPIYIDAGGNVEFPLAVYIGNFTFLPFDALRDDAPGEGHYHLDVNNAYYGAPPEQLENVVFDASDGFSVGSAISLKVSLHENQHGELDPPVEDILEFVLEEAPPDEGGDDTGTP